MTKYSRICKFVIKNDLTCGAHLTHWDDFSFKIKALSLSPSDFWAPLYSFYENAAYVIMREL